MLGNLEPERFRSLQIDDEFKSSRLLHGQLGRTLTMRNPGDVAGHAAVGVSGRLIDDAVGHHQAGFGVIPDAPYPWQAKPERFSRYEPAVRSEDACGMDIECHPGPGRGA